MVIRNWTTAKRGKNEELADRVLDRRELLKDLNKLHKRS